MRLCAKIPDRHNMDVLTMDTLVRTANGEVHSIVESDWENLVHLLDHAGVDLVKLVNDRKLDQEDSKKAGEALEALALECVETNLGKRIRGVGGQDTDPVLAIVARLAESEGLTEQATEAQRTLLHEMSTLVVRPLNSEETEKVAGWVRLLIESGGVEIVDGRQDGNY